MSFKVCSSFYLCAWKNENILTNGLSLKIRKVNFVCACASMCVHVSAVVCRAQKTLAALEVEIQAAVNCPPWAPQRAVCTLDC